MEVHVLYARRTGCVAPRVASLDAASLARDASHLPQSLLPSKCVAKWRQVRTFESTQFSAFSPPCTCVAKERCVSRDDVTSSETTQRQIDAQE